ncbi:MAG: 3-deoxy-D-manno-octulosonic acid transferase [Desulfovibrio sp.]|jgi:3-deoxy-D-manno-octulosonic-acid transferase|nr:3-deoxy-D-manno-octulosonic acid transferase [Desulfovibrio sp.]
MALFSRAFLGLYSLAWRAARPLLRRHARLADGFAERLLPEGWPSFPPDPGPCLWLQAASGGEARLVRTLVNALPDLPYLGLPLTLLCTTCTRQGLDILEKTATDSSLPPGLTLLPRYLPLDIPALMREAVRAARPKAIVLLETELWPGLLDAAARERVPFLILNARMTPKSLSGYSRLRPFWRERPPAAILAVSPEDAARFAGLFGPAPVALMPNLKFDHIPRPSAAAPFPDAPPAVALASVRREEESLLLPVVRDLFASSFQGAPLRLIIAPRHMHRVPAWRQLLASAGLPCVLRSSRPQELPPLLLWDTFGDLPLLYALADSVFVGGSLAPLGGQNFLEPLAAGVIPCVGPHIANFHWVGEELFTLRLAVSLSSVRDLAPALRAGIARAAQAAPAWHEARLAARREIQARFQAWLLPRTGGSLQAAGILARFAAALEGDGTRPAEDEPKVGRRP